MDTASSHVFKAMKESTFQALDRLVDKAVSLKVDFILMVGDIFDHTNPSLKAIMHFKQAMEKLATYDIQVYLSYGNHDYTQSKDELIEFPCNVHRFTQEEVTYKTFYKKGLRVATVYGFSYLNRAVTDNKVPEYIKEETDGFHICMLHGNVSTNTDHHPYAPFQVSELLEKRFDYWALGHIHKREILQELPPVVYPGNIQGRSRKEMGEKGCILVEMNPHHTQLTFLPLQQIRFESITIEVTEAETLSALEAKIRDELLKFKAKIGLAVIDLTLKSSLPAVAVWKRDGYLEELLEILNDQFHSSFEWLHLREIETEEKPIWDLEELREGEHFIGEVIRYTEKQDKNDQSLSLLFNHKKARKFMEPLTKEEEAKLNAEARDELLSLLIKEGDLP